MSKMDVKRRAKFNTRRFLMAPQDPFDLEQMGYAVPACPNFLREPNRLDECQQGKGRKHKSIEICRAVRRALLPKVRADPPLQHCEVNDQ